ncbi:recombination mediator RecR [Arenicella xantha]|uniref:Recombination protein RecR n=1 Tax=Arenicella xantha TaxID=644221 RepID=A0A395JH56_9GAMM|nr:recombination mediator RecR [Arenicella xantha]RBP49300.1 DNA replication and repair protein RecR [Arenicella xantha]
MATSNAIEQLKEALKALPGVGPKNAQRMAFHLMERNREGAQKIADALNNALERIISCQRCNTFCESEICDICASEKRDKQLLCVVETPADLQAIEQVGAYRGLYFVLMGKLSPLEGIGPEQLGFKRLNAIVAENQIREVIIATNITAEGETTADYTQQMLAPYGISITRLARGVPVGGELEYMDQRTLAAAFKDRRATS